MNRRLVLLVVVCLVAVTVVVVWLLRKPPPEVELPAPLRMQTLTMAIPEGCPWPYRTYLPVVMGHGQAKHLRKSLNLVGGATCQELWDLGTDWVYNWAPYLGCKCYGIPWYPMIRDRNQLDSLGHKLDNYNGIILGFNEPENMDCAAGACMTLAELIQAWHDMEVLLPNGRFTSPAFMQKWGANYTLIDFVNGYHTKYGVWPRFEIIAQHYYAPFWLSRSFEENMNDNKFWLQNTWNLLESLPSVYDGLPIWFTEVGTHTPDTDGLDPLAIAFAAEFLAWELDFLEATGRTEYINWFGPRQGSYTFCVPLYSNGALTQLGKVWKEW